MQPRIHSYARGSAQRCNGGTGDMIQVQIQDNDRTFAQPRDLDESWVNQQINRRRQEQYPVCVQVTIKTETEQLAFATADCARMGSGSRALTPQEQKIVDLWCETGMMKADFHGGNLIAFLKRLSSIL